ncbi:MAG: hypothetical protein QW775_07150 [Ignisphaera sp.]
MYGDEESGIPPNELYDRFDEEESLNYALTVYSIVFKLIKHHKI